VNGCRISSPEGRGDEGGGAGDLNELKIAAVTLERLFSSPELHVDFVIRVEGPHIFPPS